jgi:hypothetical protein
VNFIGRSAKAGIGSTDRAIDDLFARSSIADPP